MPVDPNRLTAVNDAPVRADGEYVLYWMIAQRRVRHNLSLDHALDQARALGKPLLVLEALRCGHRWASARIHHFVLRGMADNLARCAEAGVTYRAYVEPRPGEGKGLLQAYASRACVVVTDTFPTFFLPRMVKAAGRSLDVRLEAVDANGLIPLALPERDFTMAHSLRRWMHDRVEALTDLPAFPRPEPLSGYDLGSVEVPSATASWDHLGAEDLRRLLAPGGLDGLPIDHGVAPVPGQGGSVQGEARLAAWLEDGLDGYAEARNDPDDDVSSGLSAHLHFGHLGAHEVVRTVLDRDGWSVDRIDPSRRAKNRGFWGTSPEVESFLDELITWRELAYIDAHRRPEVHRTLAGNADWARRTLAEHAEDLREPTYTLEELENAQTHDEIWNAAQRQLRVEGRIHNYLRMLWGKNILAWSPTPEEAAERLVQLNNRWALDGRNPNSYAGIFWTLGRFDRAWGPERPVFGKVRYMTSRSTRSKLKLKAYLRRWGPSD